MNEVQRVEYLKSRYIALEFHRSCYKNKYNILSKRKNFVFEK